MPQLGPRVFLLFYLYVFNSNAKGGLLNNVPSVAKKGNGRTALSRFCYPWPRFERPFDPVGVGWKTYLCVNYFFLVNLWQKLFFCSPIHSLHNLLAFNFSSLRVQFCKCTPYSQLMLNYFIISAGISVAIWITHSNFNFPWQFELLVQLYILCSFLFSPNVTV